MKYILFSTALFLTACSPALKEDMSKEWQEAKEHSYLQDFREALGLKTVYPTPKEQMEATETKLCYHEDAHEREITANGIDDRINYRHCTLTPSLGPTPSRWDGR